MACSSCTGSGGSNRNLGPAAEVWQQCGSVGFSMVLKLVLGVPGQNSSGGSDVGPEPTLGADQRHGYSSLDQ